MSEISRPFADQLAAAVREKGNPVVVGLDPRWDRLPAALRENATTLTDQAAALSECFRVTRPGGRLLIVLVNTPFAALGQAAYAGSALAGQPWYWPTMSEMRGLVETAGFRVEGQRPVLRLGSLLLPPVLTCAVKPAH